MKKTIFLLLVLLNSNFSHSASSVLEPEKLMAKNMMIPLYGSKTFINLEDYLELTPKTYRNITGHKMSFKERVKFSISKKIIKKIIRKDGSVSLEKIKKYGIFGDWKWHWGGFALGFFLSLIGVIVTLFFNDENKWDRFWTALKTALAVFLIAAALVASFGL